MILPAEIQQKARHSGVRDQQIEKDYVISWVLEAVAQHEQLSANLAFKGGTVLKKVYFDNYRFSEDLDFTLLDNGISNDEVVTWFNELFPYVRDEANIPLDIVERNEHEDGGINFYIRFIGPLGGKGRNKKIKVDISRSEVLCYKPEEHPVLLSYSDQQEHRLLCYSLEEILVEKMRSVMQRMQARDFYDIWYLLEVYQMNPDYHISEFAVKCEAKGLKASDFLEKLRERLPQYKGRWQHSMDAQIKQLPDFIQVERETMKKMRNLNL